MQIDLEFTHQLAYLNVPKLGKALVPRDYATRERYRPLNTITIGG